MPLPTSFPRRFVAGKAFIDAAASQKTETGATRLETHLEAT
jgi:hypothetical protein